MIPGEGLFSFPALFWVILEIVSPDLGHDSLRLISMLLCIRFPEFDRVPLDVLKRLTEVCNKSRLLQEHALLRFLQPLPLCSGQVLEVLESRQPLTLQGTHKSLPHCRAVRLECRLTLFR